MKTKLDRFGGFDLILELPPGEEVSDEEYRGVFRETFADIGLPRRDQSPVLDSFLLVNSSGTSR